MLEQTSEKRINKSNIRKNGFDCPPTVQQILLLILIILLGSEFYSVSIIALKDSKCILITFIFIYTISFITLCISVVVASGINPTGDSKNEILENIRNVENNESKFPFHCKECQLFVESRTKHCKECNRCVSEFDHHCFWINNCIGNKNYKSFLVIIASLFALSLFTVGINSFLIYYFIYSTGLTNIENFYVIHSNIVCWILNSIILLISLVLGTYMGYLIILHIYLNKIGMTTYEYSMKKYNEDIDKIFNQKKKV